MIIRNGLAPSQSEIMDSSDSDDGQYSGVYAIPKGELGMSNIFIKKRLTMN